MTNKPHRFQKRYLALTLSTSLIVACMPHNVSQPLANDNLAVEMGSQGDTPIGAGVVIYTLATDPYILATTGETNLDATTTLNLSGSPTLTLTDSTLSLTHRGENWYTLDVVFDGMGMSLGNTYRFVATGTAPAGTQIGWHRSEAPWTFPWGHVATNPQGVWELDQSFVHGSAEVAGMDALRIQTNNAPTVDFTVDSITVYRLTEGTAEDVLMPTWDLSQPSLREVFAPYFLMGNIYPSTTIMDQFGTREGFLHHFNAVTAENWHKPDSIAGPGSRFDRPTASEFNFEQADSIVNWAVDHDLSLVGHALVWHSQSPQWLFASAPGVPHTREQALDNLAFYIRTLAAHFTAQGTIDAFTSWDVANEVFASGGGSWGGSLDDWQAGDWRTQMRGDTTTGGAGGQSGWWDAFANGYDAAAGEHPSDFVWYAFYFARQYFPNSVLYYNDYNEEIPAKRNAIAQMVEQLNARWAAHPSYDGRLLVERIGMQSHYHLRGWATNFDQVRPAIERFAATGAGISITELDITVGGFGGAAPTVAELPALLEEQAAAYARLFGYYLEFAEHIHRVSVWGLSDGQSWRSVGHPVLFDAQFGTKPAFDAIVAVGQQWAEGITPVATTPLAQVAQDIVLRTHMEALGATVTWEAATQTATVVLGNITYDFVVGHNAQFVNGQLIVELSELYRVFNVHQN